MTGLAESTLCMPDGMKSCFACCPPIRPVGYEHLSHKNIIRRILRENTRAYDREEKGIRPITGFSCWALGYLDGGAARVGCLLHPMQNQGKDLRHRVDYGDKCSRETCPEAKVFSRLKPEGRRFWLCLAEGQDAFSYSSRKDNPLFHLLGWGPAVLGLIASVRTGRPPGRESFLRDYPFFTTPLAPKACAYLLKGLLDRDRLQVLENPQFRTDFEGFHRQVSESLAVEAGGEAADPPVHRQGLDPDFVQFLRLSLGMKRLSHHNALRLKERVDEALDDFRRSM